MQIGGLLPFLPLPVAFEAHYKLLHLFTYAHKLLFTLSAIKEMQVFYVNTFNNRTRNICCV